LPIAKPTAYHRPTRPTTHSTAFQEEKKKYKVGKSKTNKNRWDMRIEEGKRKKEERSKGQRDGRKGQEDDSKGEKMRIEW